MNEPGEPATNSIPDRPPRRRTDGSGFRRRSREVKTIAAMLRLYCRAHHHGQGAMPCPACTELLGYARRRLERCPFGEAKPTCATCQVHCYKPAMREAVKNVMRWAGPRMLLRHPLLTVYHFIAARRPAPPAPG